MKKLFDRLAKLTNNEYATKASDGLPAGDIDDYIDTGSYAFNALLSGSIFKGMPNSKIIALAGEEATGKTFYALGIMKNFLDKNPDAAVFFFESEGALTKDIIESRNIDSERVFIFPVATIQEFRYQVLNVLNEYIDTDNRPPLLMILDSLGNLSTTKEVEDATEGKETRDMTRTQLIRGTFRLLNLKLSKAKVPFILTNHTYQTMDLYSQKVMSGGGGIKYASSQIIFLGKRKDKDGKDLVGNIIVCTVNKSRFTKEGKKVETKLNFETGLNRYYGLLEIAEKYEVFKKVGNKYETTDGKKYFEKAIYAEPAKHFTAEVLNKIDEACGKEFLYGNIEDE